VALLVVQEAGPTPKPPRPTGLSTLASTRQPIAHNLKKDTTVEPPPPLSQVRSGEAG
jgi:hypothetical protein